MSASLGRDGGDMIKCKFMRNKRGGVAIIIVLAIVVGALYAGHYYFQKNPRYALIQFKRAIVFKDAELAEKYLDMDSFISKLLGEISSDAIKETTKKNIIYEINWPDQKSTFASVKNWSVFTVPINIDVDNSGLATTEPDKGTQVRLEQKSKGQWIITSIDFNRAQ
jgi:AAA+ ATPase superfamily predicted ATPase